MELKEQNVLLFARTMELGGTENVVLMLCEILKPLVNNVVVCSCGGVNVAKLEEKGIKHYLIPDITNKRKLFSIAKSVKRIIKNEKITIVHTHHRMAAFYINLLGLSDKLIFINTAHNTFFDKKIMTKFAYKNCHIIACGNKVKNNLVSFYGIKDSNVTVIQNAIKPFDFVIEENELIKDEKTKGKMVIGNIGRISKQKGFEYFIEALPDVVKKYSNVHFFIVGTGEDEDKIKEEVKKLEMEDYVTFLGYVSNVQNLIAQLDFVVLSSLWEGLPLTPIEAFSVKKTIVATNVDGTVEIVNERNGILVNPKDSKALSNAIIEMIEDPKRIDKENNAYDTYINNFSFSSYSAKIKEYYMKVINE